MFKKIIIEVILILSGCMFNVILCWLRISDRIIFIMYILTHKEFYAVAPVYLCELITKHEHVTVRTRCTKHCLLLAIPPISKS